MSETKGTYETRATPPIHQDSGVLPGDLSIVGHNDMPYVDMLAPPLTTVRIRQTDIGREAARILIAVMSGGQSRKKRAILDCELIVRASTAPPRSRN